MHPAKRRRTKLRNSFAGLRNGTKWRCCCVFFPERTPISARSYDSVFISPEPRKLCCRVAPPVSCARLPAGLRKNGRALPRSGKAPSAAFAQREARQRKEHLSLLAKRGEAVWRDVEDLIGQRNQSAYSAAVALLTTLARSPRPAAHTKASATE